MASDQMFMSFAVEQAELALQAGEVPVGAVAVVKDEIISRSGNCSLKYNDPTAHAEMIVLREAAHFLNNYRLPDVVVYVTLEPCAMCFGAMVHARIQRLVYGASDPKSGVLGGLVAWQDAPVFNHRMAISGGVLQGECSGLLKQFFSAKRKATKHDIKSDR